MWNLYQWAEAVFGRESTRPQKSSATRSFKPTVEVLGRRDAPAVFTVIGTGDDIGAITPVLDMPDHFEATTLRAAINKANQNADRDTIIFDIGNAEQRIVITANSSLPTITTPMVIDGSAPVGLPNQVIVLDGSRAQQGVAGLKIESKDSKIHGLSIVNFRGPGIEIAAPGALNLITGNHIGTTPDDQRGQGNLIGVFINNSVGNVIGGSTVESRNIISGNRESGIRILGDTKNPVLAVPKNNTRITGNFIGTTTDGQNALGNGGDGILIISSTRNTIGGEISGEGNVISGNRNGINFVTRNILGIAVASSFNRVQGNYVGTDVDGLDAIGNQRNGVLDGSGGNVIGGTLGTARNIISGNQTNGVAIVGAPEPATRVQGNLIGVQVDGAKALGNGGNGVYIADSSNHFIGGTTPQERNIISGNTISGISINGAQSTSNSIRVNYIGTDVNGTSLVMGQDNKGKAIFVRHRGPGIDIARATGTSINGSVIAGSRDAGILIRTGADGTDIANNFIGTDVSGSITDPDGRPNSGDELGNEVGIQVFSSARTRIGVDRGLNSIEGNVIAGNQNAGISLLEAQDTVIQGNFIGTDGAGRVALGNGAFGIDITASKNNTIGGTATTATALRGGNLISGNGASGIRITSQPGTASQKNTIVGNAIGTNLAGTAALPNRGRGILIERDTADTIIGGTGNQSNLISGNLGHGIFILGSPQGADPQNTQVNGNFIGVQRDGLSALTFTVAGKQLTGNRGNGVTVDDAQGVTIQDNLISGNSLSGVNVRGNRVERVRIVHNRIGTDKNGTENSTTGIPNQAEGILFERTAANSQVENGNIIAFNGTAGIRNEGTRNEITIAGGNSIFANGQLGIDVGKAGVTANDPFDLNPPQNFPLLMTAVANGLDITVTGLVDSLHFNFPLLLEFFGNDQPDPSGFGEGRRFLGATVVVEPGPFEVQVRGQATFITATATDALGNTSEFSAALRVVPAKVATATSVVSSNPVTITNVPVLLTATVGSAGGTPTGSVQFLVNGFAYGSPVALSGGSASIVLNGLPVDMYGVSAVYSGDGDFAASTGFATQFVAPAPTEIRLVSFINPAVEGQSGTLFGIAFRATPPSGFFPIAPTGFIIISDTFEGVTSTLAVNVLGQPPSPLPTLAVGTHAIVAAYSGDVNFLGSFSAPLFQVIVAAPEPPPEPLSAEQQALDAYFAQAI